LLAALEANPADRAALRALVHLARRDPRAVEPARPALETARAQAPDDKLLASSTMRRGTCRKLSQ
jgi:hypothetical protein